MAVDFDAAVDGDLGVWGGGGFDGGGVGGGGCQRKVGHP